MKICIFKCIVLMFLFSVEAFLLEAKFQKFAKVEFVRVVDGDTIAVIYQGEERHLRLLGIDAFESRNNRWLTKQVNQFNITQAEALKKGNAATDFLKKKIIQEKRKHKDKKNIWIEFDTKRLGHYCRLLVYVYLRQADKGKIDKMLNIQLLKAGYARLDLDTNNTNIKYNKELIAADKNRKK